VIRGALCRLGALAGVVAVAAASLTALQLASPAWACACGGIAPPPGGVFAVSQETAIVAHDGARETIELQLDLQGDGPTAGLIVPTPAPATVTAGAAADVSALDAAMTTRVEWTDDWWTPQVPDLGGAAAPGGGAQVLGQVQLGPLQATTLSAGDADGLTGWLAQNGFTLPDAVRHYLRGYVQQGWDFVALRLTGDAPLDGALDPVRMTFDSPQPVYPMAMSKAATDAQHLRLYVLDDARTELRWRGYAGAADPASAPEVRTTWSGPAPADAALPGSRLTVLDADFAHPADDILGDLRIVPAADQARVDIVRHEVRHVTWAGLPMGWLLVADAVLFAVAGAFVLVIVLVMRRVVGAGRPRAQR
jgi:hypothetical protein